MTASDAGAPPPAPVDPQSSPRPHQAPARTSGAAQALVPVLVVLVAALLALIGAAAVSGAAAAELLDDAGPMVRWGNLVLAVIADLAAALSIGGALVAATVLPVRPSGRGDSRAAPLAHAHAMMLVASAAFVWGVATLLRSATVYADVTGVAMSTPGFGAQLGSFLRNADLGRGMLFTVVTATLVSMIASAARSVTGAAWAAAIGTLGLIPAALAGHGASTVSHNTAVTALGLHLLGVVVWVGGLMALLVSWPSVSAEDRSTSAHRYSTLALIGAVTVAGSGVISGWIRLSGLDSLMSSRYGWLIIVKVVLLILLLVAGWRHRSGTLVRMRDGDAGAFRSLAVGELIVMGAAVGVAAALARSEPPAAASGSPGSPGSPGGGGEISLTESLTGYPLPPPPTPGRLLWSWQPDLLWLLVVAVAGALYLTGVIRLRRRGDAWPWIRVVLWFAGLLVLTWVTSGGPAVYGRVQFSVHMIAHMILGMAVPILLVLGAPVTLALRALRPRGDGSRGAREWIVAVVDSPYARVLSQPLVAAGLFAGGLFLFYFSPLFNVALRTHVGHEAMQLHFLVAGYLFMWVSIGIDPGPNRPVPALRLIYMLGAIAFHSFFGVSLMLSRSVLAEPYFAAVGRTWGRSLLDDQRFGGSLAWGFGELPILAVGLILAVQWARSDERDARRYDRQADRDNDAELVAYNARLAQVAQVDARRDGAQAGSPRADLASATQNESGTEPGRPRGQGRDISWAEPDSTNDT